MKQVPYTHPVNARHATNIGGTLIHPGDTRLVDAALHPDYTPAAAAQDTPTLEINMTTLRETSIADITAKLPDLAGGQLDQLEKLERADKKPRTGMLNALDEERLRRETETDLATVRAESIEGEGNEPTP